MTNSKVCPELGCKYVLRPLYFRPEGVNTFTAAKKDGVAYRWCAIHGPQAI